MPLCVQMGPACAKLRRGSLYATHGTSGSPLGRRSFALSPVRPFVLLPLIKPAIQLKRSANQRHVSESLRKIPKLFGRRP